MIFVAPAGVPSYADTDPPPGTPPTVSADPLPTWQVNGVVWSMATVGTTVYATGKFTKARPPGVASGGAGEIDRANLLAFDITTGNVISSFDHTLNGQGLRIVASPDGSRVYVGGEFTTVDGQTRNRVAAFNTATGALDPDFKPSMGSIVRAIAVSDSTVYLGGNFFSVNGSARTRLAAVARSNGATRPWAPTADDNEVFAMVMAPDQSRVIVGGRFQTLNGEPHVGIGALDPTSGTSVTWNSKPIPTRASSTLYSYTTDLTTDGTTIFGTADGEGGHWFDGRFAARPDNGDLVWLDNCYGATYGGYATGQVFYSVSHAHDCTSVGTFPEVTPRRWQRATAETIYPTGPDFGPPGASSNYNRQPVPTMLHWFPALAAGTFTGQSQGAWSITGNGTYVALGGEFPSVNGKAQQGLTRFAVKNSAPNKTAPIAAATLKPTVASRYRGTAAVTWQTTWDYDNAKLTYEVLRDGGNTPVGTVEATSAFWKLPTVGFADRGLTPGSSHTYRVRAKDSSGNSVTSAVSDPVTVTAAGTTPGAYTQEVTGDGAARYWRFGESAGPTAFDFAGGGDATTGSGVTYGAAGGISGDADKAATFSGGRAIGKVEPTPEAFSLEAWIKTSTSSGGKIIGYGNKQTGDSTTYDRQVYMDNSGRIFFGVYPNAAKTVNSPGTYRDNKWHHVVATMDAATGMRLYVDGAQVAQDPATKTGSFYAGSWHIGGDNLTGWPSRPTSNNFAGSVDEVAVYPQALTAAQVASHHGVGTGTTAPNQPPTAAFGSSCTLLACTFNGAASADSDGTIAGYAWEFGDGATGTGATPSHTYAAGGSYDVKLTVTDDDGDSGTITKTVTPSSPTLASDTFTRTVSNGLGSADVGGAWTTTGSVADFAVNGTAGKISLTPAGSSRSASLGSVSGTDTDLVVGLSADKLSTGGGVYYSPAARKVAGVGEYRAKVRLISNGTVSIGLTRTDAAAAETVLVADQLVGGLTYAPGTPLTIRVQATGTSPTTVRAKVWASGSAEPATWQVSGTDATAGLQAPGGVGFFAYLSGSATNAPIVLTLDDLKAVDTTP